MACLLLCSRTLAQAPARDAGAAPSQAAAPAGGEDGTGTEAVTETGTGTGTGTGTEAVTETEPGTEAATESYPRYAPGGRLYAGAELVRTHPVGDQVAADSRQPFFLQQARLKLDVRLDERLRLAFSGDLEEKPAIVNAYLDARLHRALRFRLGRFKRPFSRIELESIGKLPFRSRGPWNEALIERAGYGDRALGLMVHGKVKRPRLRYFLALTNSAPQVDIAAASRIGGADVVARLEYAPAKAIEIGIGGVHKWTETAPGGETQQRNATGLDARLRVDGFELVVEGNAAENPSPPSPPVDSRTAWALTAISYASYELPLAQDLSLQPVVLGELSDTDIDLAQDEVLRVLVGCNLLFEPIRAVRLRLMPQVELLRPLGDVGLRSHLRSESYYLALTAEY